MRVANPWFLVLLLILPVIYLYYRRMKGRYTGTMRFPYTDVLKQNNRKTLRSAVVQKWWIIRMIIALFFIIALARPQAGRGYSEFFTKGIDIIMAVDASGSMLAEDFQPNRLENAKETAIEFVGGRKGDRIGLVVFGEKSFTQTPLTLDYELLKKRIGELFVGIVPKDRTAIGMALANSINRLRDSDAKSRVIILLTDGMNNSGKIDPTTAAGLAKTLGIKIYTIGVGREGIVNVPVNHPFFGKQYAQMETDVDEETLIKIADQTGGLFFRAESEEALKEIYKQIDSLEKTKVEVREYTDYKELFYWLLFPALFLIICEIVLFYLWGLKLP